MRRRASGAGLVLVLSLALTLATGGAARSAPALTGEVIAVDPAAETLILRLPEGGESLVLRLSAGTEVLRNGQAAGLPALRPVLPDFTHEARVWLGPDGEALRVEAFYEGTEARVVALAEGGLDLELLAETGPSGRVRRALSPGCQVWRAGEWLSPAVLLPGAEVYVLFDLSGAAKKIALPD